MHKLCDKLLIQALFPEGFPFFSSIILRQIENSYLIAGADNHYRFPEFSSGRLASNKWNGVWNTLYTSMI